MINKTLKYGLITGAITTLYFALLYAGGMKIFSNWWLSLLFYPILIFFMFFYSAKIKKEFTDIPFDFGKAFVTLFIIGMTASFVLLIWNMLLFNVIDHDLSNNLAVAISEKTMEMMEKWGAPESAIEETMKEMEKLPEQFKPTGQILGFVKGGIFFAIIAALGALFIRKKKDDAITLDSK